MKQSKPFFLGVVAGLLVSVAVYYWLKNEVLIWIITTIASAILGHFFDFIRNKIFGREEDMSATITKTEDGGTVLKLGLNIPPDTTGASTQKVMSINQHGIRVTVERSK